MTYDLRTEQYLAETLRQRIAENEATYGPGCRPELRERLAQHERNVAALTPKPVSTSRYEIVLDEFEVPCEHPMCEQFHQRFMERSADGRTSWHDATRRQYVIWDHTTDQRAGLGEAFETKREAKAALARIVATTV